MYTIAPPATAPTITEESLSSLNSTSFTVSWTANPEYNYIVTWTNLRNMMDRMTVVENMNSYTVTELTGMDNYNVSVASNNSCGMIISDPVTVYGKNVCTYVRM